MAARVYLDWNATAPLRPEARAAMLAAMDALGNPSSVHAEGRAARAIIERARGQVAAAAGCDPAAVVLTSGATEAAGVLARLPGPVSVDPLAHDCLWAQRRDGGGAGPEAGTRAIGLADGETGVIAAPPVAGAGALLFDAVQVFGRLPWAFSWSGADMAILSGHKPGGPKGTGALLVRPGFEVPPLQAGGGQEEGRRSGTENVIGIAGFGAAAEAAQRDLADGLWDRVAELRDILELALAESSPETIFVGKGGARLPNTSCIVTPGWKGETQVMQMDLAGFAVSAGAACSSGKVRVSRVLRAMGFDAVAAASAIRVSLGPATTEGEVLGFVRAWTEQYRRRKARAA
jgi:cysteine desulfurase